MTCNGSIERAGEVEMACRHLRLRGRGDRPLVIGAGVLLVFAVLVNRSIDE
jgi:hypothetical protein